MKKEDVDLEVMFEEDTGKEWQRTLPHVYTEWLEDKLTEMLVKNCSVLSVVGQSEQLGEGKIRCNSCHKIVDKDYCSFFNCRLKA